MKRINTLPVLLFISLLAWGADKDIVSLKSLKVGYEETPLGIDVEKPRFNWCMEVNTGKRYQAHTIRFPVLADVGLFLPAGQAVRKAAMEMRNFHSPANTLATLQFGSKQAGKEFPLLLAYTLPNPVTPMLCITFTTQGNDIAKARLYVTAQGIYDVYLNGIRIGNDYFNPDPTQYNKTQLYQTFDTPPLIRQKGQNALGAVLAESWLSGCSTFNSESWIFSSDCQSLLAKLVITYTDGSRQVIVPHPGSWKYYGDDSEDGKNDKLLLWGAYFIHDLDIMHKTVSALGNREDACWYARIRDAREDFFCRTYLQPQTYLTVFSALELSKERQPADTQVSYALALAFSITDSLLRTRIAANLANTLMRENIADDGMRCPPYTLMTGFIGTPRINRALSDNGYSASAYRLLQQTKYLSWFYPVEQGTTSIWERLNSYTHINGFGGNTRLNSFNHYSFGSVEIWMIGRSLDIECNESEPAFKRILLRPEPDPTSQMKWAHGYYDSRYGCIASNWEI